VPALPDFHARYPDIQLDIGASDRPVDLTGESVDCVIRAGAVSDQSLVARRLGAMRFVTCAAPSYLARHGAPQHPGDLEKGHIVVGYFNGSSPRAHPLTFIRGEERLEVRGRIVTAVNESNVYLAAGLAGLGVIMAPTFMVEPHIASGALVPLLAGWDTEPMPLYIAYAPHRHLSNKLRVFVDWVAEQFAGCAEAEAR